MELLKQVVLVTHFLGLAALIGGWLAMRFGGANAMSVVVWGARIQVITGVLLVGIVEMGDLYDPNHMKIGVKLLVAVGALAAAEIASARAKRGEATMTLADAAGGLAILNVLVAVLWR